jgi:hypothetical protein
VPWWQLLLQVAEDLRACIVRLYDAHLSPNGRSVNYSAMRSSLLFKEFETASAELQRVRPLALVPSCSMHSTLATHPGCLVINVCDPKPGCSAGTSVGSALLCSACTDDLFEWSPHMDAHTAAVCGRRLIWAPVDIQLHTQYCCLWCTG